MGLLDTLNGQTDEGRQLRGGLLNMGIGLLSGSTGHYGQFAPALAQGFAGFQQGQQQVIDDRFKKAQTEQMQAYRNMQMQGMAQTQQQQQEAQQIISSGIDPQTALRHANPLVREWASADWDRKYKERTLAARAAGEQGPVGAPFEAMHNGQPVLVQRYADGSLKPVEGFQPKLKDGFSVTTNPDGTVSVSMGGNKPNKLSEQQSKDLVYLTRGESSIKILDELEKNLESFWENAKSATPIVGNHWVSSDFQRADQAGRDFLAAILRKDTGAAITNQEFDIYGKMYLPRPGDSAETLAQKKEARRVALDAIRSGLGAAADGAPPRSNEQAPQAAQQPSGYSNLW